MDKQLEEHFQRLQKATFNSYSLSDIPKWIVENTKLNGDFFSFKGHEFQLTIASDTSRIINVQKPAQIGMSELMARYLLAFCRIVPSASAILTFPYSADAENFMKTRINPVIRGSDDLSQSISADLDNTEIKGFGSSLLYARGSAGQTQALSIPADILVHDELDKSDPDIIGQYQSRIRHSRHKLVRKFSTPTIAKRGISAEMDASRRLKNLCKCNHCNFWFQPDYFEHIAIPGYTGEIRDITKDSLRNIRWQEAKLLCPACGEEPSLFPEHREWVMENTQDNYEAVGYLCSPFDVPTVTSISDLINESTKYKRYSEFENQGLGIVANNENDQITETDLLNTRISAPLESSELHCMGADMGLICHINIGRLTQDGMLMLVHRERVPLGNFEVRKAQLQAKYRVLVTVCDSQPYVDLILKLQRSDKNLFGGVYHNSKNLATYEIKMVEEDKSDGKLPINQAKINREVAFDEVMRVIKEKKFVWSASTKEEDDSYVQHLTDMKREQKFDSNRELTYVWTKSSEGNDHYHHALLYLHTACKLMPTAVRALPLGNMPVIYKFRVRQNT